MYGTTLSEILLIVNNVEYADELSGLISQLVNFTIPSDIAGAILDYRNRQEGKRITSLNDIGTIDGIPDVLKRIINSLVNENSVHSTNYPFLLLPLRLETRFMSDNLWIRIYPDQIFINSHILEITEREFLAGSEFLDGIAALNEDEDIGSEEKENQIKDGWRRLAAEFGSERAAYIIRYIKDNGRPDDFRDEQKGFFTETGLQAIPRRFMAFAFRGDSLIRKKLGRRIPPDLNVIDGNTPDDDLFTSSTHWIIDHEEAEKNGMAICIDRLSTDDMQLGFDKLLVVGIRGTDADIEKQALRELIDNHHYSSGISFCELHTPTNNTGDLKSGYSESLDDYEESYNVEIKGPPSFQNPDPDHKHFAELLGKALGFDDLEIFRNIANSGSKTLGYTQEMNSCIWPAAGKFFLSDLLGLTSTLSGRTIVENAGNHFIHFVRALGHLPSIRIDTQPYGILPVTSVTRYSTVKTHGWKPSDHDASHGVNWTTFDRGLHGILTKLFDMWLSMSRNQNRVPRMTDTTDPDQSLMSILSMEPVSYKIKARPILSDSLQNWILCAFKDIYFGIGSVFAGTLTPEYWAGRWFTTAKSRKEGYSSDFADLTGMDRGKILNSRLMNLFAWDKSDDINIDFDYFARLSLLLTYNRPEEQRLVKDSINFLKNVSVLEFLNTVDDPKVIARRVIDDPFFRRKQPAAYGVLEKIAARILAFRKNQPNQQIKLPKDLLEIEGLGIDTLHDIIYSFTNIDYGILLEFFNSVSTPEEIVDRIKDDPAYIREGARTRGITRRQAEKIIQVRDDLLDGEFSEVRQIHEVEGIGDDSFHDILNSFVIQTETQNIDWLFNSTLDLFSHRLDAWFTSLAFKRLESMRAAKGTGIYLGAYGWVENLKPKSSDSISENAGYIHAPSRAQASAGAVLYNAYLTHRENGNSPYKTNLESHRVRKAMQIIEGMRQGQALGALLGYIFERELHENKLDMYIDEFRAAFPISTSETAKPEIDETTGEEASSATISARNVVDGLSLLRWLEDNSRKDINLGSYDEVSEISNIITGSNDIRSAIHNLKSSFDAVNDLLLYESMYHTTQGNYERAGAFMDAMAGKNVVPEIESIRTPLQGNTFENRVCLFFPKPGSEEIADFLSPRSKAAPRLAKWITGLFGSFDDIKLSYSYQAFKLNINREITADNREAFLQDLQIIPGISETLAGRIIEFKEGRVINDLDELMEIEGIGEVLRNTFDRWIYLGDSSGGDPFIAPVNINTAPAEVLEGLPGIGPTTSQDIIAARGNGGFDRIGDLTLFGMTKAECDKLRRFCTTGRNELTFAELNTDSFSQNLASEMQLQPLDILYLSAVDPGGGETEIEKRLKYWIRREHGLNEDDNITIIFDTKGDSQLSYLNLVQLSQQVMKLLGNASLIRPKDMSRPDEDDPGAYSREDVLSLSNVAENISANLGGIAESLTDPEEKERTALTEALMKASLYGIPVAVPSGSNQEDLGKRAKLAIAEINKRIIRYGKNEDQADEILSQTEPQFINAIKEIENGIKALLGKDFIVLPEFTSNDPDGLNKVFNLNKFLGDSDSDRVRLWVQQAALTRGSVNELENTMILVDTLPQAATDGAHFNLMVGQFPYLEGNRWLGLSDDERVLFSIDGGYAGTLNDGVIPEEISRQLTYPDSALSETAKVLKHSDEEWRIIDGDSEYALRFMDGRIAVILKSGALNNVSIVAACCGRKVFSEEWRDSDKSVSGLKIDGWFETIPDETVNTSVAFHYDAPNTQPPQALLLAVPPDRDKTSWEIDDLAQIIFDTMDLYKIRAVDFEALRFIKSDSYRYPIGAFLPTTVVPVDASRQGWEKLGDTDLITDWLKNIGP